MNYVALVSAYKVVSTAWPVIKEVASLVDAAIPASPGKDKAEAAFAMLSHAYEDFKTVTPELQVAFNGAISLYQKEKALLAALHPAT